MHNRWLCLVRSVYLLDNWAWHEPHSSPSFYISLNTFINVLRHTILTTVLAKVYIHFKQVLSFLIGCTCRAWTRRVSSGKFFWFFFPICIFGDSSPEKKKIYIYIWKCYYHLLLLKSFQTCMTFFLLWNINTDVSQSFVYIVKVKLTWTSLTFLCGTWTQMSRPQCTIYIILIYCMCCKLSSQ